MTDSAAPGADGDVDGPDPHESTPDTRDDPFHGPAWGGDGRSGRGRRRRSSSRRRTRRRLRLAGALVLGLVVLGGIWLVVTALLARHELSTVRAELTTLHDQIAAGQLTQARGTAEAISTHTGHAAFLTSGPAWSVAAAVPSVGRPFAVTRDITTQANVLGKHVLPSVVAATHDLDPSHLRTHSGAIRLQPIAALAPRLARALHRVDTAVTSIRAQPAHTWLSSVDAARADLLTRLTSLQGSLTAVDRAASVLPPLLGQHGTKRYFVAFQNDAEARGTGGLPGAFAIVSVTDGKFSFDRFESDGALAGVSASVRFGKNFNDAWGSSYPYYQYVDSNASPNFPYAAQIWMSMWKNKTGQQLDGALALDPQAVSYLLGATGPAALPDGSSVTAANVVALTQKDVYERYQSTTAKGNAERKAFLLAVAKAVSTKVLGATADPTGLVKAAARAAGERRLLLYSSDPAVEAVLTKTSLAGAVPSTDQPYAGLVVNNGGGNKLDYYLDRSLTWKRTGCGQLRTVTVTATLTNDAPTGLPRYVTERNDFPDYKTRPGDNLEVVYYYGTHGGTLDGITIDGRQQDYFAGSELGHPVYGLSVELPRGQSRTIVFHLEEPAGSKPVQVLRQPLVRPLVVHVDDQKCSS